MTNKGLTTPCDAPNDPLLTTATFKHNTLIPSHHEALVLSQAFNSSQPPSLTTLTGQYLSDAFMLWECYENCSYTTSPLLLRFDYTDVVIHSKADHLHYWKGSVDTAARIDMLPLSSREQCAINDHLCLTWQRVSTLKSAIGEKVCANIIDSTRATIVFSTLTLSVTYAKDTVVTSLLRHPCVVSSNNCFK